MSYSRWLELFEETVGELYFGEKAEYAREIACKVAPSFCIRMERKESFKN